MHPEATSRLELHDWPTPLPGTRLPFERRIWSVDAPVTLVRHEPDEDVHIVLEPGADQMIAESPSAACTRGATSGRRRQARVVGVAFFDFKHGQTEVAPNAIELHPILDFACLVESGGEPNAYPEPFPSSRPGPWFRSRLELALAESLFRPWPQSTCEAERQ